MSSRLPVVSGEQLIRALQKVGYVQVRQRGSHVRLRHRTDPRRTPLSVPLHDELAPGLLRPTLRDAQLATERLIELL